jgi:hypothetical protein
MIELSNNTRMLLHILFQEDGDRATAASILTDDCADGLPLMRPCTPEGLERIRAAVLKLSGGKLDRLKAAVREAHVDWRDVLVMAGFANDVEAHTRWIPRTDTRDG